MSDEKPLKDIFNNNGHSAVRSGDNVLEVTTGYIHHFYDFATRMLLTRSDWGSNYNVTTTPFGQIDREVLVVMRDKLVDLGGAPPQLAAEAGTFNKPARGLNP